MKKSAAHAARLVAVVIALGFLTFYVLHAMGIVRIPSLRPRAQQATSASSKNAVVYEAAVDQSASENNQVSDVSDYIKASQELARKDDAEAVEAPPETSEDKLIIMPSSKVGIMDFEKAFGPVKEEQPAEKEAPKPAGPPETFQGSKSGVPVFPVTPPPPEPAAVEIPAAKPEPEPAPPSLQHTFGSSKALVPIIKPEPESEPAPEPEQEPEIPQTPPVK